VSPRCAALCPLVGLLFVPSSLVSPRYAGLCASLGFALPVVSGQALVSQTVGYVLRP